MALREGNHLCFSPDGEACLGYALTGGACLVLGPPAGPWASAQALLERFDDDARSQGLRPVFCGIPKSVASVLVRRGYRVTSIGDEALVDPADISLTGKEWREVRSALNRAARTGIRFSWVSPQDRTEQLYHDAQEVSLEWLSRKRIPELRFAVGSMSSLSDPSIRLGTATDEQGLLLGLVTWVPVPKQDGWMLELLRCRSNVMAGLADYLVATSLLAFQREGCRYASLSGTPLANVKYQAHSMSTRTFLAILSIVRPFYDYRGLHRFKNKFNPRWEPLYIAYTGWGGLPRTLLAVARACSLRPSAISRALPSLRPRP